jgi:signal transduction histidine kinase
MGRGYRDLVNLARSPSGDVAVLLAVAVVLFGGNLLIARGGVTGARPIWPGGVALMAAGVAALAWRRRRPVLVLALTAACAIGYYLLDYPAGFEPLPFVVALYGASSQGYRVISAGAALLAAALVELVQVVTVRRVGPVGLLVVLGWLVAVIVFAEVVRGRRAYLLEVERRAVDAERTRESEAARRVAEERLRIARELHDALAHQISVISLNAGAAILRQDSRPELAREVMPVIKQAAADAMRELRAALGVLRRPGEGGDGDDRVPLEPAPGLDRLDELVLRIEAAGPRVRTRIHGRQRPLPTGVDLAAYRIVQEALTNVTRHARDATATVVLDYRAAELDLRIDDDGRPAPHRANAAPDAAPGAGGRTGTGNGLLGMRERAASIGGRLDAGPRDGGGFGVHATLPLPDPGDPA